MNRAQKRFEAKAANSDAGNFTGAYIMAKVSAADAARLVVPDGDPASNMHITLGFLNKPAAEYDDYTRFKMEQSVQTGVSRVDGDATLPMTARAFAVARFNDDGGPDGDMDPATVLLVQSDAIANVHANIEEVLGDALSTKFPIWQPHVTLGYNMPADADYTDKLGDITFDQIVFGWGNDQEVVFGPGAKVYDEAMETKVRRVRSAAGEEQFHQPIGSIIVARAHVRPNRYDNTHPDISVPMPDPKGQLELRRHLMEEHGYDRTMIGTNPRDTHTRAHAGPHGDYWAPKHTDVEEHHHHPDAVAPKPKANGYNPDAKNTDIPYGTLVKYQQTDVVNGVPGASVEQAGTWKVIGTARNNKVVLRDTTFGSTVEVYAQDVRKFDGPELPAKPYVPSAREQRAAGWNAVTDDILGRNKPRHTTRKDGVHKITSGKLQPGDEILVSGRSYLVDNYSQERVADPNNEYDKGVTRKTVAKIERGGRSPQVTFTDGTTHTFSSNQSHPYYPPGVDVTKTPAPSRAAARAANRAPDATDDYVNEKFKPAIAPEPDRTTASSRAAVDSAHAAVAAVPKPKPTRAVPPRAQMRAHNDAVAVIIAATPKKPKVGDRVVIWDEEENQNRIVKITKIDRGTMSGPSDDTLPPFDMENWSIADDIVRPSVDKTTPYPGYGITTSHLGTTRTWHATGPDGQKLVRNGRGKTEAEAIADTHRHASIHGTKDRPPRKPKIQVSELEPGDVVNTGALGVVKYRTVKAVKPRKGMAGWYDLSFTDGATQLEHGSTIASRKPGTKNFDPTELVQWASDEIKVRHVASAGGEEVYHKPIGATITRADELAAKKPTARQSRSAARAAAHRAAQEPAVAPTVPQKRITRAPRKAVAVPTPKKAAPAKKAPASRAAARSNVSRLTGGKVNNAGQTPAEMIAAKFRPATAADRKKKWGGKPIPPAWTDVMVAKDPNWRLQATGIDQMGRKQPLYHPDWTAQQAAEKHNRVTRLAKVMPKLDRHLTDHRVMNDDTAAVVYLMRHWGVRVDSSKGTAQTTVKGHHAFGATTLQKEHVTVSGNRTHVEFIGKANKLNTYDSTDPLIAKMFQKRMQGKKPGERLFNTDDKQTIDTIKTVLGQADAKNHDLRTHYATSLAVMLSRKYIAANGIPQTKKDFKTAQNYVADSVAKGLNDTRTVAIGSYIAPDTWMMLGAAQEGAVA